MVTLRKDFVVGDQKVAIENVTELQYVIATFWNTNNGGNSQESRIRLYLHNKILPMNICNLVARLQGSIWD